jgi:hypothetical protein
VQRSSPLEERDAIRTGQPKVGRHESYLFASVSQPLQAFEPGFWRVSSQHPIVGRKAPKES